VRLLIEVGENPEGDAGGPESLAAWLRNGDEWLVRLAPAAATPGGAGPPRIDLNLLSTSGLIPLTHSLLSWLATRRAGTTLTVSRPGRTESVTFGDGPADPVLTALPELLLDAPRSDSGDASARRRTHPPVVPGSFHKSGDFPRSGEFDGPVGVTPPGPPFGDDDDEDE
jgi:hypothetical protein